jgi:hypothetical protein
VRLYDGRWGPQEPEALDGSTVAALRDGLTMT